MERLAARAEAIGYRSDWRGRLAYLLTPEAWTTRAYTAFVLAAGALLAAWAVAIGGDPPLVIAINVVVAYLVVARPVLRVADRRADLDHS